MKKLILLILLVLPIVHSFGQSVGKLPYKKILMTYKGDTLYAQFDGDSVRLVTNKKWAFWPALPGGVETPNSKIHAGSGLTQDNDSTISFGGSLNDEQRYITIGNAGQLSIGDSQSYNTFFSSGSGINNEVFRVQAGSQSITMNNTILNSGNGLIYGGDYSATYTNRSLVDKAYVDNKVSSAAGGGVPSKLRNYSSGTDTAIVVSGIGTAAYGSFINNDGGYACLGTKNSTNYGIWSQASGYATAIRTDVTDGTCFSAIVSGAGHGLNIFATNVDSYGLNIYGGRSVASNIGVLNTDGIGYKAFALDSVSITSSVRTAILGKNSYYTDFDAFGQQRLYNNSVLKYKLATDGSVTSTQFKLSTLNTAPTSATDAGVVGEVRITSTYIYVCTATNTWVRTALTTW
jgi:hypothetical protein